MKKQSTERDEVLSPAKLLNVLRLRTSKPWTLMFWKVLRYSAPCLTTAVCEHKLFEISRAKRKAMLIT